MEKKNRLILNQEILKRLNENVQYNNNPRFATQAPICNTKFQSCPECNPPGAKER